MDYNEDNLLGNSTDAFHSFQGFPDVDCNKHFPTTPVPKLLKNNNGPFKQKNKCSALRQKYQNTCQILVPCMFVCMYCARAQSITQRVDAGQLKRSDSIVTNHI